MQDLAEVSEALAEEQSQAQEQRQTLSALSFLGCQLVLLSYYLYDVILSYRIVHK